MKINGSPARLRTSDMNINETTNQFEDWVDENEEGGYLQDESCNFSKPFVFSLIE